MSRLGTAKPREVCVGLQSSAAESQSQALSPAVCLQAQGTAPWGPSFGLKHWLRASQKPSRAPCTTNKGLGLTPSLGQATQLGRHCALPTLSHQRVQCLSPASPCPYCLWEQAPRPRLSSLRAGPQLCSTPSQIRSVLSACGVPAAAVRASSQPSLPFRPDPANLAGRGQGLPWGLLKPDPAPTLTCSVGLAPLPTPKLGFPDASTRQQSSQEPPSPLSPWLASWPRALPGVQPRAVRLLLARSADPGQVFEAWALHPVKASVGIPGPGPHGNWESWARWA